MKNRATNFYKLLFISLVFIMGITSCKNQEENEKIINQTVITSNQKVSIKLSQIKNIGMLDITDTTAVIDEKTNLILKDPKQLTFCFLLAEQEFTVFYLEPNTSHNIAINKDDKGEVSFIFDEDDYINNFTTDFHKQLTPIFMSELDENLLLKQIDKTEAETLKQLQQIESKINTTSYNTLKSMVIGKMAHLKFILSEKFKNLTAESPYYDFVNNLDFDDTYLTYSDNLNTVLSSLSIRYEREFKNKFEKESIDTKINFVNKTIQNNEVKSAIISFLVSKAIPEKSEKEKLVLLEKISDLNVKSNYIEYLKSVEASTATGKRIGNKAKYLETLVPYDEKFNMKQLEGKTLYIDNWATWCNPCMKAMQDIEKKQHLFNEVNNFVYVLVSYDRSEEIWRKYVKNSSVKNANIIYFYNGMDMKSDYSKFYNISSLPNYLLVNSQGLISDLEPKTPEDRDFISYLKKQ